MNTNILILNTTDTYLSECSSYLCNINQILSVFLFIFIIYFLYIFLRNMFRKN